MADEKIHITDLQELDTLNQNCMVMVDDGTNSYKYDANKFGQGGGGSGTLEPIIEVLFDTPQSISAWASPILVSCNPLDYDLITFEVDDGQYTNALLTFEPHSVQEDTNAGDYTKGYKLVSGDNAYINRTSNAVGFFTATGTTLTLNKVVGYRFCGALQPIIYSTEEREVGVWKDNKPLYQKTITLTATATDNLISNTNNIETLVEGHGLFTNSDASEITYFPYTDGEDYVSTYKASNGVHLLCSTWFLEYRSNVILTIQYTKTTDTAGSGSYNTLGVPTVHYSTDEQVIGTDYDGKPLYQKTYTNLGTINSSTNIDLQLSNISWITVDSANSSLSSGIPFPYLHSNADNIVGYFMDLNGGSPIINIRTGSDASGSFTLDKLTVRYKKTTD